MLSKNQRVLLRRCSFNFYSEFGESDQKRIDELIELGLVDFDGYAVSLTEKGKAELEFFQIDNFRFWLPVVLSIIAIVISVIALIKSS